MTSSIIAQTNTVLPHSGTPKHLADLPTELVHAIAGFLWRNIDHTNWYDPLEAHYLAYGRQRKYMRRDVLSLSACSKQLRRTFFYDDLIKEVTASLDTEELLALAALPEDVRSCVHHLVITHGKHNGRYPVRQVDVGIVDFAAHLPNLTMLSVCWPLSPGEVLAFPPPPSVESALVQDNQGTSSEGATRPPSSLVEVRIRAFYEPRDCTPPEEFSVDDQLGCLMRQFRFPGVRTLTISIGGPEVLDVADRNRCLTAIIDGCNQYPLESVTQATLVLDLDSNGRTRTVNTLEILSLVFRECWASTNIKRLYVSLRICACPKGQWSEAMDTREERLRRDGPLIPCSATPPPRPDLANLVSDVMTGRPGLERFSFLVQCSFGLEEHHRFLGSAKWKLAYPVSAPTGHIADHTASTRDMDATSDVVLDLCANVDVRYLELGKHANSVCCAAVRYYEWELLEDATRTIRNWDEYGREDEEMFWTVDEAYDLYADDPDI